MYEKISNRQMMEIIKITDLFHPIRRLRRNSVLVVNKPVKQHLYVVLWKWPLWVAKKHSIEWAYIIHILVRAVLKDGFTCTIFTQNDFPTFMVTKLFSKGTATVRHLQVCSIYLLVNLVSLASRLSLNKSGTKQWWISCWPLCFLQVL